MIQNKIVAKRLCLILLAAAFFMANVELADAYFYNITYKCNDNICIEGQTVEWIITLYNYGSETMEYTTIELIDHLDDSKIAEIRRPFYPLSSDRGNPIVVKQNEKVAVNLTGKAPRANYPPNFVYYPCFTRTITDSYELGKYAEYEKRYCYKENLTIPVVRCISNENCKNNEVCSFNFCIKLNCKECQYIENYTCFDYECCSSEQCGNDEICKNNICQKLNCKFNERLENKTCKALNCGFDEYIANQSCKKLDCNYDEYAFNNTCKKLNCSETEFVEEHECKQLNCKENEYAGNHSCKKLNCLYNETIFNHACIPLKCYFFQDIDNHACTSNKSVIFKLILELVVIIAIIIFLILDIRKYEARHKNLQNVQEKK